MQIAIEPSDITAIGSASVVVVNPTPNFAPSNSATFSIVQAAAVSGRVTENGNGLAGVNFAISGPENMSVTSDINGNFNVAILNNGGYTLAPSKPGYTFTPATRAVNYAGFSQTGQDFTATLLETPITISGRVFLTGDRVNHTALVTLTDANGNIRYTRINPNGVYRFVDVLRGGTYTIAIVPRGNVSYQAKIVSAFENALNIDFIPNP